MTHNLKAFIAPLLVEFLILAGCGSGQTPVTAKLATAIGYAEAIVTTISNFDPTAFPPAEAARVNNALAGAVTALNYATTELASTDSALVMGDKIGQEFVSVIKSLNDPALTVGVPATVITGISLLLTGIQEFLATVHPPAPAVAADGATPAKTFVLTTGDLKALPALQARAAALQQKLAH